MPPELLRAVEMIAHLPGIGRKSAFRIVFHLTKQSPQMIQEFCDSITSLVTDISTCAECGAYIDKSHRCEYCSSPKRDRSQICVVEQPSDIIAIENTNEFFGLYHILGGVLSPLDGVGPDELSLAALKARAEIQKPQEIIVATNPSVEGNATAHYIADMLKPYSIKISRLATGLALGQQLDYADTQAVSQSFRQRVSI